MCFCESYQTAVGSSLMYMPSVAHRGLGPWMRAGPRKCLAHMVLVHVPSQSAVIDLVLIIRALMSEWCSEVNGNGQLPQKNRKSAGGLPQKDTEDLLDSYPRRTESAEMTEGRMASLTCSLVSPSSSSVART